MTKNLGSRSNASLILAHVREYSYVNRYSSCVRTRWNRTRVYESYEIDDVIAFLPEGWKYLGSGWSRDAFLGPDGVVYKVARGGGIKNLRSKSLHCSRTEADFYTRNAQKAKDAGFRLAACRLLNNSVLAMEYVKKSGDAWGHDVYGKIEAVLGLYDLHSGNVWLDENGVPTLIDYAD